MYPKIQKPNCDAYASVQDFMQPEKQVNWGKHGETDSEKILHGQTSFCLY